MKDKIKKRMLWIGIVGVILGRILNRTLSSYFGYDTSNIILATSIVIVLCSILVVVAMGHYTGALILFLMTIPIIIGGIGVYLNNMIIAGVGILLIFIICPILIKFMQKMKH